MTIIDGQHTFEFDCHHNYYCALAMKIIVDYDVEIYWDDDDRSVGMGKVTPTTVVIVVGQTEITMIDVDDLHGDLAKFIHAASKNFGLEDLGITDEQAKDHLAMIEEDRQFRDEHATGRV